MSANPDCWWHGLKTLLNPAQQTVDFQADRGTGGTSQVNGPFASVASPPTSTAGWSWGRMAGQRPGFHRSLAVPHARAWGRPAFLGQRRISGAGPRPRQSDDSRKFSGRPRCSRRAPSGPPGFRLADGEIVPVNPGGEVILSAGGALSPAVLVCAPASARPPSWRGSGVGRPPGRSGRHRPPAHPGATARGQPGQAAARAWRPAPACRSRTASRDRSPAGPGSVHLQRQQPVHPAPEPQTQPDGGGGKFMEGLAGHLDQVRVEVRPPLPRADPSGVHVRPSRRDQAEQHAAQAVRGLRPVPSVGSR